MQRDNIIVVEKNGEIETWGSIKDFCSNHPEFPYHTICRMKFPFVYKGFKFRKTPFRTSQFSSELFSSETIQEQLRNKLQPFWTLSAILADPNSTDEWIDKAKKLSMEHSSLKQEIIELIGKTI